MLAVRKLVIGEGLPKICAPLVGGTADALRKEAEALTALPVDMAEWRADCFSEAFAGDGADWDIDAAADKIAGTGALLRSLLKDMPILFTLRTEAEGGRARLSLSEYERIITLAASGGFADLFDIELFTEGEAFARMTADLHGLGVKVVGSSHDFDGTPSGEEMLRRLERMRGEGADVCKIAVMPAGMEDVITLLSTSLKMKRENPDTPLIALSMGDMGVISRVAGGYFGSDITFASAGEASAPGQLSVKDCRYIMDLLYHR